MAGLRDQAEQATVAGSEIQHPAGAFWNLFEQGAIPFEAVRKLVRAIEVALGVLIVSPLCGWHVSDSRSWLVVHHHRPMRIQLVTQMWPSEANPDLGVWLVPIVRELERGGNAVEVTAISKRGGPPTKYAQLGARAVADARRFKPDVVFAHFLFPAGAAGAMAARSAGAPLVVMAHGQDVRNAETIKAVRGATRMVVVRAAAVICNSAWLAERLRLTLPAVGRKLAIANCGIDLDMFEPIDQQEARRRVGWPESDGPAYACIGSLIERKNVLALASAFERLGRGSLAFVGDGPLRSQLEGRSRITVTGRLPQEEVPAWIAAADVLCQPSFAEPFGQATLEGIAMERSVLATTEGGPPEFVTPAAGVLVDPSDPEAIRRGLEQAAALPRPNPAARTAAASHDVREQTALMEAVLERAIGEG